MAVYEVRRHGPVTEFVMGPTMLGRPAMPFRCYLVDGLLIDTGPPNQARDVARLLREFPIRQVVNTHHHEDHAGNNALVTRTLGIVPLAHPLALPILADLPPIQLYRKLTWGAATASTAAPLGAVVETGRHAFRVIHTPGHAPDHVVLVEPNEGWAFTGDLYIHDRLRFARPDEDPYGMIASLGRMAEEAVGRVWCAHRGPVDDGQAALRRKHENLGELGERVRELHGRGLPARAIARRLLGRDGFMAAFSVGDFTSLNLVRAFLAGPPAAVGPGGRG